jgi:hypothetical protein
MGMFLQKKIDFHRILWYNYSMKNYTLIVFLAMVVTLEGPNSIPTDSRHVDLLAAMCEV